MRYKSIMFHHFHDENGFIPQQGSISGEDFCGILDRLEASYEILDPDDFIEESLKGTLRDDQIALTFDDGLKCQYAIARPVLRRRGLKAFFFIYTAIFDEAFRLELNMEVLRDFRHRCFANIEEFYDAFFHCQEVTKYLARAGESVEESGFLADRKYLSFNDRVYRYLRDNILSSDQFKSAHEDLMNTSNYNIADAGRNLFLSEDDSRELISDGHEIGLHSHNHPTAINSLPIAAQKEQYRDNYKRIWSILGIKPRSVSYPNGQSNPALKEFFAKSGIEVGFLALDDERQDCSPLLIPRSNHMQVIN